jgi:polyferredoxin/tetratricopeptide (TPR) repeat protein
MKDGCESKKVDKTKRRELPVISAGEKPRSRAAKWRAAALVLVQLLMAAHIIQWQMTGRTVSPIEPSETMFTLQNGAINAGAIFFTLAILSTLILGRWVCGWMCHVVALQDFCAWLMNKIGIRPRPFRSRLLMFVPIIAAFYMFLWPVVVRAFTKPANQPLIPEFTNHLIVSDFWATFPPVWVAIPFLFIVGFVTVYFLGSKGFCTYGCPYGGVFVQADKVAPGRIRVTDDCEQCGICTTTCMANVKVHAEVAKYGMVIDPGCMKHMDCISVCPKDALYFGFGKPPVAITREKGKTHQLSWPEEIFAAVAFIVSYFAVWDVYNVVPLLLALALAAITAFVALRFLQFFRKSELPFLNWKLKSAGKIQLAGILFMAFAAAWLALIAHSGFVRYHEKMGALAFEKVQIPDELALAQADPTVWLGEPEKGIVASGREHLDTAIKWGALTNAVAIPRLAWFEYLSNNPERAVELLAGIAEHQSEQPRALSLYYRGAILNRLGRHEEALASLDSAIRTSPQLATAAEEKGEALWRLGKRPEAFAVWSEAAQRNPALPVLNNFLAGAARELSQPNAATYEARADARTPNDAYFHFMLAQRLARLGFITLAEKHHRRATTLNPSLRNRELAK